MSRLVSHAVLLLLCLSRLDTGWCQTNDVEWKEEMERTIQQLQKRVQELETGLEKRTTLSETPAPGPEQRLDQIENDLASVRPSDDTFRVYWKEGLRMDTPNKDFRLKAGGLIQLDYVWWVDRDDIEDALDVDLDDGVEFRRAEVYTQGLIYESLEYKAQWDFASGDPVFGDCYIGLVNIPVVGGFRVGHIKEPFSLEELTSCKAITFMERAIPVVFAPCRNNGAMLHNHVLDDRVTWAAGVFRETDFKAHMTGDEWNFSARVTGLPFCADKGRQLFHLGAAYSYREPTEGFIRYRARPPSHNAPRFIDIGVDADEVNMVGGEAAWVAGPFSLQGEYVDQFVKETDGDRLAFSGWYAQASVFLTGEHRGYKTSSGTFDRIRPKRNFLQGGPGAIELAARFANLDLDDEDYLGSDGQTGDSADAVTVGANWYLNPNARMMLNYAWVNLENADADASLFGLRFQVDF